MLSMRVIMEKQKIPLSIIRKKCNAMSRGSIARMLIEYETTKELTENNKIIYIIYRKDNSKALYKTILSIIYVT